MHEDADSIKVKPMTKKGAAPPAESRQARLDREVGELVGGYFGRQRGVLTAAPDDVHHLLKLRAQTVRAPKRGRLRVAKTVASAKAALKR
jgi:hypothetical protein